MAFTTDIVQWRAGSFSLGAELSVVLYECKIISGEHLVQGKKPTFLSSPIDVPVQQQSNPVNIEKWESTHTNYWQVTCDERGTVTYTFKFGVYKRDQVLQGCYSWDPSIEIR